MDFGSILNGISNAFMQGNPLTNRTFQDSAASILPKTYSGSPIRDFLAPQSYAQVGHATQPNPIQSVQGANTQVYGPPSPSYSNPTNNYPTAPTNPTNGSNPPAPAPDPYAALKASIGSDWDNYLNSLGGVGDYLGQQRDAQNGIADTQLQQGQNAINAQKANSLRDIGATTRSAFQAGNNYLGSLGAGDSSAANQYAFAINKQAMKQTGDLNNFVNGQLNNLQATHDTQIGQIANWFGQQQANLKQQIANGQLQKGQDINNLSENILNQAIQATNMVKQNTQNQYNALLSWAANNSSNFGQLQQNIAAIPHAMSSIQLQGGNAFANPTYVPSTAPSVPSNGLTGNQKTDIFGNPIG